MASPNDRAEAPQGQYFALADFDHRPNRHGTDVPYDIVKRKRFETIPLVTAAVASLCLALSYFVIAPSSRASWMLGFNGQIIVIGFLLGVMNLCTGAVVPHALLILEARYGRSRLQNYECLLTNKVLAPKASLLWRILLIMFMALPLGLSVAYKKFTGGHSVTQLKNVDYMQVSHISRCHLVISSVGVIVRHTGVESWYNKRNP